MALPEAFTAPFDYFREALSFLEKYAWIYQNANTCFLKAGTLEQMPQTFRNYFMQIDNNELNTFPLIHQSFNALTIPDLLEFREKVARLTPLHACREVEVEGEMNSSLTRARKLKSKKQHEIIKLTRKINENLNKEGIAAERYILVDFGAGLGYLGEMLYELNHNYRILGLETNSYRIRKATQRFEETKKISESRSSIIYIQHYITEESSAFIENAIMENFKYNYATAEKLKASTRLAIIGLHACADLTITSMKLFFKMPQVDHLIIMPCCYHKLEMCNTTFKFRNFPLSEAFKDALHNAQSHTVDNNYVRYLNRPFLRLACQQTSKRWSKCSSEYHRLHGIEMFLRALAEAIIDESETIHKFKSRKPLDLSLLKDFKEFRQLYELREKATNVTLRWRVEHEKRYKAFLRKYENCDGSKLAEGLICLQTTMQKMCENLVLYDRLYYMQELGQNLQMRIQVHYEKLLDEELSPRCHVLIAKKLQ
uniref:Methyltransferase domain-containing protein n=1 Tax=Glossina palpalis gambiensis TaxID=67801 RepID=A0A1B0B5B7_9MUSC